MNSWHLEQIFTLAIGMLLLFVVYIALMIVLKHSKLIKKKEERDKIYVNTLDIGFNIWSTWLGLTVGLIMPTLSPRGFLSWLTGETHNVINIGAMLLIPTVMLLIFVTGIFDARQRIKKEDKKKNDHARLQDEQIEADLTNVQQNKLVSQERE